MDWHTMLEGGINFPIERTARGQRNGQLGLHRGLALLACLAMGTALGCQRQACPLSAVSNQAAPSTSEPSPVDSQLPTDPLTVLNEQFRAIYRRARHDQVEAAEPIILVLGDQLTLFSEGTTRQSEEVSQKYHALKAIAHVPLALDVLLIGSDGQPLDAERRGELAALAQKIQAAEEELDDYGFSPDERERQRTILRQSAEWLARIEAAGTCSAEERITFCRAQMPYLMANVEEAARLRIDAYESVVAAWEQELGAGAWARLKVVVLGAPLPRRENLAVQYFARRLGEKGEGQRIIYAESIFELQPALDLLGTHQLDRQIASNFFADSERMHRDLLGDAAAAYLAGPEWDLKKEPELSSEAR